MFLEQFFPPLTTQLEKFVVKTGASFRSELILLLDAHMPIINRKSIAVAAMGFVVLFIQTWSVNTVRGQEVARLRAGLNTSTVTPHMLLTAKS